jgi:hypothetical protein
MSVPAERVFRAETVPRSLESSSDAKNARKLRFNAKNKAKRARENPRRHVHHRAARWQTVPYSGHYRRRRSPSNAIHINLCAPTAA